MNFTEDEKKFLNMLIQKEIDHAHFYCDNKIVDNISLFVNSLFILQNKINEVE